MKDIEDLQYLKISNVDNFINIFDNWDKFEEDAEKLMMEVKVEHETISKCEYIKESGEDDC